MTCNGICQKYKVTKPHTEMGGRYNNGHKRCNECEIFIKWAGKYCPCCGTPLRTRPRNSKNKAELMIVNNAKRI